MNETATYADVFNRAFAHEPEFLAFLDSMQARSHWDRQPTRELEVIALDEHDPLTRTLRRQYAHQGAGGRAGRHDGTHPPAAESTGRTDAGAQLRDQNDFGPRTHQRLCPEPAEQTAPGRDPQPLPEHCPRRRAAVVLGRESFGCPRRRCQRLCRAGDPRTVRTYRPLPEPALPRLHLCRRFFRPCDGHGGLGADRPGQIDRDLPQRSGPPRFVG